MPTKWKIFTGANLLVGVLAFIVFASLVWVMFTQRRGYILMQSLVGLGLFSIGINSFLNLLIIQRYFPDKWIPARTKFLSYLLFGLTVGAAIGLLVLCIFAWVDEFDPDRNNEDPTGKWILLGLVVYWIALVVILIMQFQLIRKIRMNYEKSIGSMIDSIGKNQ